MSKSKPKREEEFFDIGGHLVATVILAPIVFFLMITAPVLGPYIFARLVEAGLF